MRKLLTTAETAARLGIGDSTLRRLVDRGECVQPVILAPRRVAFYEDEIEVWLAHRPRGRLPAPVEAHR